MTTWTTYRLRPKPGGGFHFGVRGLEQEESASHCPSDTLFAALVATLADLEGPQAVDRFTAPCEAGEPPFLITSAFPRLGALPLLPFPSVRLNLTPRPGQRKLFKRLRYVSPTILRKALTHAPLDGYVDPGGAGRFLQAGRVWLAAEERDALPPRWQDLPDDTMRTQEIWRQAAVDRVTVDRVTSASAIYRMGRTVYAPECGLWVGVQWPDGVDAAARAQLELLLAHLGDRGLGGERSVGYGQFSVERDPLTLDLPDATADGPHLTLSRYLPRREELPAALQGSAAYALDTVAGWLSAPGQAARRRRQVRLLSEGSVFEPIASGPWGRMADVRPAGWDAHPIWRWGYACPVGAGPAGAATAAGGDHA